MIFFKTLSSLHEIFWRFLIVSHQLKPYLPFAPLIEDLRSSSDSGLEWS